MNRRQLVLRIGGLHLLKVFLRFHPGQQPNPRLLDPKAVLSEHSMWGERLALAGVDSTYQTHEVDPLFWMKPEEMTDLDIAALREIFDLSVTMTPMQMRAWAQDSRFIHTVNVNQKSSYWKAKRRLLEIARMKGSNDTLWGPKEIVVAQEVGFVVQSLNVARFVDYRLWALLRTFGSRWEYPNLPYLKTRTLPLRVQLEKEAARLLTQKSGTVSFTP